MERFKDLELAGKIGETFVKEHLEQQENKIKDVTSYRRYRDKAVDFVERLPDGSRIFHEVKSDRQTLGFIPNSYYAGRRERVKRLYDVISDRITENKNVLDAGFGSGFVFIEEQQGSSPGWISIMKNFVLPADVRTRFVWFCLVHPSMPNDTPRCNNVAIKVDYKELVDIYDLKKDRYKNATTEVEDINGNVYVSTGKLMPVLDLLSLSSNEIVVDDERKYERSKEYRKIQSNLTLSRSIKKLKVVILKETININKYILKNLSSHVYPSLSKLVFRKRPSRLDVLIDEMEKRIDGLEINGVHYIPVGTRSIQIYHESNTHVVWQRYLVLLSMLGLIIRRIPSLDGNEAERKIYFQAVRDGGSPIALYTIPEYTQELLATAEERAAKWVTDRLSIKRISYAYIRNDFGEDIAALGYGSGRIAAYASAEMDVDEVNKQIFTEVLTGFLENVGYVYEKDLLNTVWVLEMPYVNEFRVVKNMYQRIEMSVLNACNANKRRQIIKNRA